MVNEINHRDTYFDKGDEVLEYTRCGCEMEAQGEVDKLTKIGVNARY